MRTRLTLLTAACLLAAAPVIAQTQQAPRAAGTAATSPFTGSLDIGGLVTTTDGDEARFERYRDARDGLYSSFGVNRETDSFLFNANARHVGYRDQRYDLAFVNRRVKFAFDWMSLPVNFSYLTRTPYTSDGNGTLTLDDAAQRAVQGPTNATNDGSAVGVPCAPGALPAACSTAAQVALAKTNRSVYDSLATPFDLRYRRDTTNLGLTYAATQALDVDAKYTLTRRNGEQPWGGSFSFNDAVEVPQPIEQRTNNISIGTTWAQPRRMLRVAWDGSWFTNNIPSLTWDNPIRITDFSNGLPLPSGPFDPSGYSNGNGPAQGRMALPPSSMSNVVSATGLYKLPGRTTLNGTVQLTSQMQDERLIPWTINSVINTPAVFAAFPHLAQLPRQTAEAEARGINTLINLSSRPSRATSVTVRYRYNDRDVRTPTFDATEYVRFDAVPEEIEEGLSHQFDTSRHIFDANVAFTPSNWGTLRVGYGHEAVERHGRGFSDVGENIFRVSYDTYSSQYVTVRASIDIARRRGEGFVEAQSGNDEADPIVGAGGTQPTLRYFDEADRDRMRESLVLTVMPHEAVDLFLQVSHGKDEYMADNSVPVSRPGELFGLQDVDVTNWSVGFNVHPSDVVAFGVTYGRDSYEQLQRSRNANPPPDPSWTDPNRDWTLNNDESINTFTVFLDLLRAVRNTDIRFSYDYSDSNNDYVHGGPRIAALTALNQFIPLPTVENTWHRAQADLQYFFTSKIGVGLGYYFEKLDIVDFNTIDTNGPVGFTPATGDPRLDWLGALTLGYGNRPYTGHSTAVRLLYRF